MNLSVEDAATLLAISPRAVRARLQRGELRGKKVGGRWEVSRDHLPLTAEQHASRMERTDAVRGMVDDNLPSPLSNRRGASRRYLPELACFRAAVAVLARLGQTGAAPEAERHRAAARVHLEAALTTLGRAWPVFHPPARLRLLDDVRSEMGAAAARLALAAVVDSESLPLATAIEDAVLPPLAGMCRAAERRLPERGSDRGRTRT